MLNQEKLNAFLKTYLEEHKNTGVLRITVKDEVIYETSFGYANIERKEPFCKESMFSLYSLSKPFCAIGLLKLKDKGLICLDAHPGDYIPEAKGFDERVTVRQLLHHISGVPDILQDTDFKEKGKSGTPDKIRGQLEELSHYPNTFEPGTADRYTNINFTLCALIIENVSGMEYSDYMEKEVFAPLGMKNALVDKKGLEIKNRVTGYEIEGDNIFPVDRATDWAFGGGDIVATVDDVYCLNKAIKHKLLLSAETWDEALTPSPINDMGMGCTVYNWHGKRRIHHNGGWDGFRTLHIQLPEDDFDIIFLSNSGWGNARYDIAEAVFEAYYGKPADVAEKIEMDKGYAK